MELGIQLHGIEHVRIEFPADRWSVLNVEFAVRWCQTMMIANTNIIQSLVPIVIGVSIMAVCVTVLLCLTWNVEPYWRKYLQPFKQYRQDWWRIRITHLRARHADSFVGESPFKFTEQHLNIEKDAEAIIDHVQQKVAAATAANKLDAND